MPSFKDDLRAALWAAHEICGFVTSHDLAEEELRPLLEWQGQAFASLSNSDAIEDLEKGLSEISTRDPHSALAVELLNSEVSAVKEHLSGLLGRWNRLKPDNNEIKSSQRSRAALKAPSRRALGILTTLIGSLADILGDLFPGLKALLGTVKEAAEHFA